MQDRVYQKKVKNVNVVNELRERLVEVWAGLQQNVIDDVIDQWRRRLRACVRARDTIRYDTIGEFNVDWKAEYSALSSTRSQKKKLKQPTPVPL